MLILPKFYYKNIQNKNQDKNEMNSKEMLITRDTIFVSYCPCIYVCM